MIPIHLSKGSSYGGVNLLGLAVLEVSKFLFFETNYDEFKPFLEDKINFYNIWIVKALY